MQWPIVDSENSCNDILNLLYKNKPEQWQHFEELTRDAVLS